jgi:hypothetical protein
MKPGHIGLDGKEYMIELSHYQRATANPFAAKLGTGAGDYSDLDDWAAWLMEDWRQGVGQKDAEGGGYLFGEADSRFGGQLILPPLWTLTGTSAAAIRQPGNVTTALTTNSTDSQRYGCKFTAPVSETVTSVWVFVQAGVPLTVGIYSDSSGPDALVGSGGSVDSGETTPGYGWVRVGVSAALTATTVYWLVVYPTAASDGLVLPANAGSVGDCKVYDGSSWTNSLGGYASTSVAFFYAVGTADLGGAIVDVVGFNGAVYAAAGTQVYKWGGSVWAAVGSARGATITDLQVFDDKLYIGLGDSTNFDTMTTGEVYANGSVAGRLFYQWNGYLYRAVANDIYYTTATSWTGPVTVGPEDFLIRGMAAKGEGDITYNDLYIGTDDALSLLAASDLVLGRTAWGSPDTTNGRGMIHHQGDVWIPVGNGLIRYTGGQLVSVGLEQGEGLPALRQGQVRSMVSLNNYLLACVEPDRGEGMPTVWADRWHPLVTLPAGMGAGPMMYDRANSRLWIGTEAGFLAWVYVPDGNDNPLLDASATYAPFAWLETGWFSGGLKEVVKDVESVYVTGTLAAGQTMDVYWQDDDSTGWELLARFDRERQEASWPRATRPATRQMRLGLLLGTNNRTQTPKIEAVRTKYVADVRDRWRWQLPVRVASLVEMLDGHKAERTGAEMRADLETAIRSVAPVVLRDVDGRTFDVKVTAAQESVGRYEIVGDQVQYESVLYLSLLQVSAG